MSTKYTNTALDGYSDLRSTTTPAAPRRIRLFNNPTPQKPTPEKQEGAKSPKTEQTNKIDLTTWILAAGLLVQIVLEFKRITSGVEFQSGLFYSPTVLLFLVGALIATPAVGVLLVHDLVIVRNFRDSWLRASSVLAGVATHFMTYQILFVLLGTFAHLQANAIDFYCVRFPQGNESACAQARGTLAEMPRVHRLLLSRSSSLYGKVTGKTQQADLALLGLLRNTD